jgi:hypothetical protein
VRERKAAPYGPWASVQGSLLYEPRMTYLLLMPMLVGFFIVYQVWKHETPTWFRIGIGAVWGLAHGLLAIDLFAGGP